MPALLIPLQKEVTCHLPHLSKEQYSYVIMLLLFFCYSWEEWFGVVSTCHLVNLLGLTSIINTHINSWTVLRRRRGGGVVVLLVSAQPKLCVLKSMFWSSNCCFFSSTVVFLTPKYQLFVLYLIWFDFYQRNCLSEELTVLPIYTQVTHLSIYSKCTEQLYPCLVSPGSTLCGPPHAYPFSL